MSAQNLITQSFPYGTKIAYKTCMETKKNIKLKTLGKLEEKLATLPVFAGAYVIINFVTWAS